MNSSPSGMPTPSDCLVRGVAIVGLMGIALIHFLDVFGKFRETPYLGVSYVLLIIACLLATGFMLVGKLERAWILAAVAAVVPMVFYALSRTTGLPASSGDIGNWEEPLGLASLFVEGSLAILSWWVLSTMTGAHSRPRRVVGHDSHSAVSHANFTSVDGARRLSG
jgi:hypothetical protein